MKVIQAAICYLLISMGSDRLRAVDDPSGGPPVRSAEDSAEKVAIRDIAEAWVSFYNAGDSKALTALYTEDGYYVSAHILAQGHAAIEKYWAAGIAAGGHVDFIRPVEIRTNRSMGYFLGKYQATNAGLTVDGRIVIVTVLVDGVWKIAIHETVVRDQPE